MSIPRQIDRRVRQEIAGLNRPWRIVKKRDHYFLQVEDKPLICVASNSSKSNEWQIHRTIEEIRKQCPPIHTQPTDALTQQTGAAAPSQA